MLGAEGGHWRWWSAHLLVLEQGNGAALVCCWMPHDGTGILGFSFFIIVYARVFNNLSSFRFLLLSSLPLLFCVRELEEEKPNQHYFLCLREKGFSEAEEYS